jgi:hypothetical protein
MEKEFRSAASADASDSDASSHPGNSTESPIPRRQSEDDDARHGALGRIGEQDGAGEADGENQEGHRGHAKRTARDVLNAIGANFVKTVDKNRGKAYANLRSELMKNIGTLVPDACSIEQLLAKVIDIENFVKGDSSEAVESPQEALAAWLKDEPKQAIQ